jgi:hypothetical protein
VRKENPREREKEGKRERMKMSFVLRREKKNMKKKISDSVQF